MWEVYHIVLLDDYELLHDEIGESRMKELEMTLQLYSQPFIRKMVSIYNEMGAGFFIEINENDEDAHGSASWGEDADLLITLNYNDDGEVAGVNHSTLSHELAHAMHFIIEENIGEDRAGEELMALNQGFPYTEDYEDEWDEELHSPVFSYDYGMYNHLEDWATMIEEMTNFSPTNLTTATKQMSERLIDPQNEPLLIKAQYIREMIYKYISDECSAIFRTLYESEDYLRAAA